MNVPVTPTCADIASALNLDVNSLIGYLTTLNNDCFQTNGAGLTTGAFNNILQAKLAPIFSGLNQMVGTSCNLNSDDVTTLNNFNTSLNTINDNIGGNLTTYTYNTQDDIALMPCWMSLATGMPVVGCSYGLSCFFPNDSRTNIPPFSFTTIPNWTTGLLQQIISFISPSITFANTTGEAINLVGLEGLSLSSTCLGDSGSYQIPATISGTCTARATNITLLTNQITFIGVNTSSATLFTTPVTFGTAQTINLQNALITVTGTGPSYSIGFAPQTVSFQNNSGMEVDMVVDSTAFTNVTGGAYTSNYYPIGEVAWSGTIGNLLNQTQPISFKSKSGALEFSVDFTQPPASMIVNAGPDVQASASLGLNGGGVVIAISQVIANITFDNTTGKAINLSGVPAGSLTSTCLTGSGPYQIPATYTEACTATAINTTVLASLITFTGVNTSAPPIPLFTTSLTFGTAQTINLQNALITVTGTGPSYSIGFAPQTVSFLNSSGMEVDMYVDQGAFTSLTGLTYSGTSPSGYYQITSSCTATSPCTGTTGDLLNQTQPISFKSKSGALEFSVDFTQPPASMIVNAGPDVQASASLGTNGGVLIAVTPLIATITFTNTTGEAINLVVPTDLSLSSTCLEASGSYQIPAIIKGTCTATVINTNLLENPITFTGVNTSSTTLFTIPVNFGTAQTIDLQNASLTVGATVSETAPSYSIGFAPQAVSFHNTSGMEVDMVVDSTAFTNVTGGAYKSNYYPIGEVAWFGTIGNLLNQTQPISFKSKSGALEFSVDFTQPPASMIVNAGPDVQASASLGLNGGGVVIAISQVIANITFDNTTGEAINLSGVPAGSLTSTCLTGSGPYQIPATYTEACTATAINTTVLASLITFTGVNTSAPPIPLFTTSLTFGTAQTINLQNALITVTGTGPSYSIGFAPQTVSFLNSSGMEVDMYVDQGAFTSLTGSAYLGTSPNGYYPITSSCTATSPCIGTTGDLLNQTQPISFKSKNGALEFSVDFTKPIASMIVNLGPDVQAAASLGANGGVVIAVASVIATITFTNTTGEAINLTGVPAGSLTSACLTGSGPYQIPAVLSGACTATATNTTLLATPITFSGVNTAGALLFTTSLTFGTAQTKNLQNALVTVSGTGPTYSIGFAPQIVSFQNSSGMEVDMWVDPSAFTNVTGGAYTSNFYPIGATPWSGTIGDLLNQKQPINFKSKSGALEFSADFTKPIASMIVNLGPDVQAAASLEANGGIVITISQVIATITFANTTGEAINLVVPAGVTLTSTCLTGSGPYQIPATINGTCIATALNTTVLATPITFSGVNTAGAALFTTSLTFGTAQTKNLQNALVTVSGTGPLYSIGFNPVTVSFQNSSGMEVDMWVDSSAFTNVTGGAYTGNYYPIDATWSGTIGNLLNQTQPISFKSKNGALEFTIDFTKPPASMIVNSGPDVQASASLGANGGVLIAVHSIVSIKLSGGISQIIQEIATPTNMIVVSPPNVMSINFVKSISTNQQNTFNTMLHRSMGANISIGSSNIKTTCSPRPPSLGGSISLPLDSTATFLGKTLTNSLGMGFSPQSSLTHVTLSTNSSNIALSSFPSGQSFSISTATANMNLTAYKQGCVPLNTLPLGGSLTSGSTPIPVTLIPLYTFTGIGGPNLGSNLNTGSISGTTFSFTFALPTTVTKGVTSILSGSSIQITDATQPVGSNQIIFNLIGSAVTGTLYGQSISGTATMSAAGSPSITITGTTPRGLLSKSFTFNTGITGVINLAFQ